MSAELSVTDAALFRDGAPTVVAAVEVTPAPIVLPAPTRRLPFPHVGESLGTRIAWIGLAVGVAALYFLALMCFWAPAHPGVDQNGYFVGGRQFASTLSSGMKPASDYAFVGRMWVMNPETNVNFPKYPLGLPILFAACLKVFGEMRGVAYAHLISPISAASATLGVFAIVRRLSGGFMGVMAMLLLACGQVFLTLAINPNSHAAGTCAIVWGMFFLLRWLESGVLWRGVLAAFLFGVAYTIRYTDGLLLLPLGVAMLYATRWALPSVRRIAIEFGSTVLLAAVTLLVAWKWGGSLVTRWPFLSPLAENHARPFVLLVAAVAAEAIGATFVPWRSLWRLLLVQLAWLVPVAYLTLFNMVEMHAFTSYAGTNESTGFSLDYFSANWEKMIRVMNDQGLFFIAPLGLLGLVCMVRRLPLVATILTLWFVPSVLLYTAYYWAPDNMGVSYSRFVLTQLPALVIAAAWLMGEVGRRLAGANARVGLRLSMLGSHPDASSLAAPVATTITFALLAVGGAAAAAWGVYQFDAPRDGLWWAIVVPGAIACVVGLSALPSIASARWAYAFDRHFARSTTRLGIACVVFVSCSLGAFRTVNGSEWGQRMTVRASIAIQSYQNNNLAGLGVEVRRAVGKPAADKDMLMFADGERLHHLQWIGGWQLFDVSSFNADRAQRLLWRQTPDENDPDPIDPSRIKFLRALYKDKDQRALQKAQDDLIGDALANGKRVVYVLNDSGAKQFARQIDRRRFDVKPLGSYNDVPPPRTPDEFLSASEKPKEPVNRFGRGNALNNPNLFAGPREAMKIGEVVLKPPTVATPTTKPATTRPATTRPATQSSS